LCRDQLADEARCGTGCRSWRCLKSLPRSQTGRTVPPFAGKKGKSRIRTHEEGAGTEVSSDTYPLRATTNRACGEAPRALVPAGTTKVCPLPASAPSLPRAPGAPKGWSAQARTRRPEDRPPLLPARVTALREQAGRPDSPGSPQLPWPRGQVPPRPAPVLRVETLMSRPRIPTAPAHSGASSMTPGPASDPG
jgi:hypothetical protein